MVKRNMAKLHFALTNMKMILNGLTRGLDLSVIDRGFGTQSGCPVSYFPTTKSLGLVMPSNSPSRELALAASHRIEDPGGHQTGP
jgi:hypothetical protein